MLTLPAAVNELLQQIAQAGGSGWVVGGAVRDMLMGIAPHDWDIAVNLTPKQLLHHFPQGRLVGGIGGTVQLHFQGTVFEITPFRAEGQYTDARHPDTVQYVPDVFTDLLRRDFTVNAMAYNGEILLDPFAAQKDIAFKLLRTVGPPLYSFRDDPLRILRMVRLAAQLGFQPEARTMAAARVFMPSLAGLPVERVRSEIERALLAQHPQALRALINYGGLAAYGLRKAAPLQSLAQVPATRLCRWWALCALCGVNVRRLGKRMGFSGRFIAALELCDHLFEAGPATNILALKQKLRGVTLDYASVSIAFGVLSPHFKREALLYMALELRGDAYCLADLAINGDDLLAAGIHGPKLGQVLDELLSLVISNPSANRRDTLLAAAQEIAHR